MKGTSIMIKLQQQWPAIVLMILALIRMECLAATHYVVPTNPAAANPFTNWATAGTNIIDVVKAAMTNTGTRLVWITNGTYYPTNQIVVTNVMTIRSVNGRDLTILNGGSAGNNRCVALANGDVFNGLTVTNYRINGIDGTIYSVDTVSILNCLITGNRLTNGYGGGVYSVRSTGGTYPKMTNCIVSGNWAQNGGGGIYMQQYSTIAGCVIENNTADLYYGGGICAYFTTYTGNLISNCFIINNRCNGTSGGGGIYMPGVNNDVVSCVITGNVSSRAPGGGMYLRNVDVFNSIIIGNCSTNSSAGGVYGTNINLRNCLIAENTAGTNGGGAYIVNGGKLVNCTIAGNSAGVKGGGLYQDGTVWGTNTVVYYNTAPDAPNFTNTAGNFGLDYSCVTPAVSGVSNIISDPDFVSVDGGNYRLRMSSPCINAGAYQGWMTNAFDLDLNPRLRYGSVDMGAYETYVWQGTVFTVR